MTGVCLGPLGCHGYDSISQAEGSSHGQVIGTNRTADS